MIRLTEEEQLLVEDFPNVVRDAVMGRTRCSLPEAMAATHSGDEEFFEDAYEEEHNEIVTGPHTQQGLASGLFKAFNKNNQAVRTIKND